MSAVRQKDKKQKNRVLFAAVLVLLYVVILLATLKYTGVIKFPSNKKANITKEKTDIKNKGRSPVKTVKAAENKTGTTTTTTPVTTTTTLYTPNTAQQTSQQTDQNLKRLVRVYESMDSDQAAKIIAKLSDSDAIALLSRMNTRSVADILAAMDVQRAASLSKKMGISAQ